MSFGATKLVALLVYPLSLSLLLCLLALMLLWRSRRRSPLALLGVGLGWLYLCSTAFFADFLMGLLERDYPARAMSAVRPADAIVLLGGGTRGYAHMATLADLNQHGDRLVHAAALYQAGKAPLVLVSGGALRDSPSEAVQMRDLLRVMGVPPRAVLLEEQSLDTYQNALFSAQLLHERGLRRILLVTSAFHMRRAAAVFRAQGLEVEAAPTDFKRLVGEGVVPGWLPGTGNLSRASHALHELAGYGYYRYRGWL